MSTIVLERAFAPSADLVALIGELDAELARHYAPDQRHGLRLDALFDPHVRFYIARRDGAAAGCGGVALFDGFAELKRFYVRPAARGTGVADALVERAAADAVAAGLRVLRLESGIHQQAALRFYRRLGFAECAAFEPYASMAPASTATSVFMEKRLG